MRRTVVTNTHLEQDAGAGWVADGSATSVLDTTELRWFAAGRLPVEIESWFTATGTAGVAETRRDSYRVDGLGDRGVKRRSGRLLELKVRRSVGERLVLDEGLAGRVETWRKWSPADRLVERRVADWVDVEKRVVKRRFSVAGDEAVLTPGAAVTGAGCDAEVAAVTVDGVEAWTFALAAFGPEATRRDAMAAAWRTLTALEPAPRTFEALFDHSGGYAAWLAGGVGA